MHVHDDLKSENRLSSPYTFFYKLILPVIQLISTAVLAFIIMLNDYEVGYIFVGIMIIILFLSLRRSFPLKHVWLQHDHILVKDFSRKIMIPLYSIVDIKENKWFNPHFVTVKLRADTEFGQKITFIPDRKVGDAFKFLKDSKVTQKLKQAIQEHKQG